MRSTAALQLGWLGTQTASAARFRAALVDPEHAQTRRLRALVRVLGPSAYGRDVGLDRVQTLGDLARLPILEPRDLPVWVERIASGEPNVLTTEPIEALEPTGGTTGTRHLPITARFRQEVAASVGPWMVDLHTRVPALLGTRAYWSVSRAVRATAQTSGGVPIGLPDDAAYFGPVQRWAIRRLMAVDPAVAQLPTMDAWRRATAVQLLSCADLGLISVWSPTFLTVLVRWIEAHREELVPELPTDARRRLEAAWDGRILRASVLWPRLSVVSAWADGFASAHLPALAERFGDVRFQAKGLLATEGAVSFPFGDGEGHVLGVTGHVLELRDLADGTVLPAHRARVGSVVQPVLTTGAGLVRYALPDAVEVVGHTGRVPRIRLQGRLDHGSDLVGEKLTPDAVDQALRQLWGRRPGFAMLVPDGLDRYTLVVDGDPPDPGALDRALCDGYHVQYARDLGQLRPPAVRVVPDAWARWEAGIERMQLGLGDQKPGPLETRAAVVASLLGGAA